jgi:hypothetical protein
VTALAACGGGSGEQDGNGGPGSQNPPPPPPPPTVQSVVVSPSTASIEPGKTMTFSAVARDASGSPVAGATFTWATSDANIATIDGSGVALGIANGAVTISAIFAGVRSNSAALTVASAPTTGPTSEELIAAALAAGEIDAETALVYRVFAGYAPNKLPAKYRGIRAEVFESSLLEEVATTIETLSPSAQDQLMPFLRRPGDIGSWLDPNPPVVQARLAKSGSGASNGGVRPQLLRPTCLGRMNHWSSVDPFQLPFRVWFDTREPSHGAFAATVAAEMQTKVWPTLITRLGFKPPLDDSTPVGCHGEDGRLDIYIVDANYMTALGETQAESSPSYDRNRHAVYITIRADLGGASLEQAIAHEFAHAIHHAYPKAVSLPSYGWFKDGFANWAALQVYAKNTAISYQSSCIFDTPEKPLDDRREMTCAKVSKPLNRDYGAYLPLEYISKTSGQATVRRILEETATASNVFQAFDTVFAGKFDDVWKDYALTLWNQDDIRRRAASFFNWDDIDDEPELAIARVNANLNGAQYAETALEKKVNNMSVKFHHFTFSDEKTRSLMFHNSWNVNKRNSQKVSVQAIFLAEGSTQWKIEDWSDYEWIGFCRDAKEQRLAQLVVVVASAEWRLNNATPVVEAAEIPKLMRNNIGCWGYAGDFSHSYSESTWNGSWLTQGTARFDYLPGGRPPQYTDLATNRLRVPAAAPLFASVALQFIDNHSANSCSYSTNVSLSDTTVVQGGSAAGSIVLNNFIDSMPDDLRGAQIPVVGANERSYFANGVTNRRVDGTVTGPQPDCGTTYQSVIGAWLLTAEAAGQHALVDADGHLHGTFRPNIAGVDEKYTWDLAPIREP